MVKAIGSNNVPKIVVLINRKLLNIFQINVILFTKYYFIVDIFESMHGGFGEKRFKKNKQKIF